MEIYNIQYVKFEDLFATRKHPADDANECMESLDLEIAYEMATVITVKTLLEHCERIKEFFVSNEENDEDDSRPALEMVELLMHAITQLKTLSADVHIVFEADYL